MANDSHWRERKRLIDTNPFDMKNLAVRQNRERDYYVTREQAEKVLDSCPDNEWRILFALSRFAGLRCPSEHLALRWCDIDWAGGRMTITSPKTEHHEGGEFRVIPLFPEVRALLDIAWNDPRIDKAEFVITRYRDANANPRTQFQRIITRAGITPWPKLFQNLRASMATDLAGRFPAHVAAEWLGHSVTVAAKHYLQTLDSHYDLANVPQAVSGTRGGTIVAQESAPQGARTDSQNDGKKQKTPAKTGELLNLATPNKLLQISSVTPMGLEPMLPP